MDKNNGSFVSTGAKNLSDKPKFLAPSVLGLVRSHGVKLSPSMSSEDKKNLLSKVEEWRKARKDKLAARILNKQKQFEKVMIPTSALISKSSKHSMQNDGVYKIQSTQLYKNNNAKIKKPDIRINLRNVTMIPKTSCKKSNFIDLENPENSAHNFHSSAIENRETETTKHVNEFIKDPEKNSVKTQGKELPVLKNSTTIPGPLAGFNRVKNPMKRSVSMIRLKCINEPIARRSFSVENLNEWTLTVRQKLNETDLRTVERFSPYKEPKGETEVRPKFVSFLTPRYEKGTSEGSLRSKLEEWLNKNGHSLEGYRHLRCFGINRDKKMFDAAHSCPNPLDTPLDLLEVSRYDSRTSASETDDDDDKENVVPPVAKQTEQIGLQVGVEEVGNWLRELHRLMVELKFPPERCEEWLAAIRKRYDGCPQLPIYWECLAALYESKGDLNSAIENYERAIMKSSEVNAVGDSLAQLFEKMVIEEGKGSKPKLEKGLDPKNIFKSTIIKFALQQKALKKVSSTLDPGVMQQLYVATPVRRSTRIQTPKKSNEEVTSLKTLTPELRENVIFKPNYTLLYED